MGYSLQANAKTIEGAGHPDRNAQFEYVDDKARRFLARGEPVISVDTKEEGVNERMQERWKRVASAGA
jgi:Rhodopirellula transposase DDE domain